MQDSARSTAFHVSRPKAWARLGMGWICAQSLLTLLPIAAWPWGAAFLMLTGGGFVLMALSAVRLLCRRAPLIVIDGRGIGEGAGVLPWERVVAWREDRAGRRLVLTLADGSARRLSPGASDATLTRLVEAVRQARPDLESLA